MSSAWGGYWMVCPIFYAMFVKKKKKTLDLMRLESNKVPTKIASFPCDIRALKCNSCRSWTLAACKRCQPQSLNDKHLLVKTNQHSDSFRQNRGKSENFLSMLKQDASKEHDFLFQYHISYAENISISVKCCFHLITKVRTLRAQEKSASPIFI